jgi:hypothetical protein
MPRTVAPDTKPEPAKSDAAVADEQNSLVAAAITVSSAINRRKYRKTEPWQTQAWNHYDARGPLRYATSWFANALSRAKLVPARIDPELGITPITSGPAYDAMQELYKGADGGAAALLKAMGQHFFIAGEWYLVGRGARPEDDTISTADEIWEVVSVEEMKVTGTGKNEKWSIDYGDGEKIPITAKDVVIRMWNPHPRKRTQPDSPVKAALGDLTELEILSHHIGAQVFSRLAGAGLLVLPSEMTFAKPANAPADVDGADPFMVSLANTMTTAVNDPASISSLVPIIIKAPGEYIEKIQHLTFWSPLDDKAIEMRTDAIRNLAISLDLPPEVLTGTADVNHWGAWQIEESSIKAHIEPALEVIAGSLTTAYLRKVVDDPDVIVAYDTSALRLRPNRSKEALELYDRGELNGKALRRETGFENDDAHDESSFEQWLLKKVATGSATPEMVNAALGMLGVDLGPGLGDNGNNESRPDPSLQQHPTYEPPQRDGNAEAASLMATCNVLAYRAFERAGNRLKNKSSSRPPGVLPEEMHCYVTVDAASAHDLLDGAWAPLPSLLGHVDVNPLLVERSLDAYVRAQLTTGQRHDHDLMQRFIFRALEQAS